MSSRPRIDLVDLLPDFAELVRTSSSEPGFKAGLWSWIDAQRRGVLGPFLSDVERFFPRLQSLMSWSEAQEVLTRLQGGSHAERARSACARIEEVTGRKLDCGVILLAGLERPEGYSRFHRGRNTIHVALDHASNLRYADHLEVILAHELTHSLRDPAPEVLADGGGWPEMSHEEFVARYTFREHLVSEALATALSELAYPSRPDQRYIYLDAAEHAWCEGHRPQIVARIQRALDAGESFRTFYAPDVIAPGSPECCDYYLALHLGRFALTQEPPEALLSMPQSAFFARFWSREGGWPRVSRRAVVGARRRVGV